MEYLLLTLLLTAMVVSFLCPIFRHYEDEIYKKEILIHLLYKRAQDLGDQTPLFEYETEAWIALQNKKERER